MPIEQPFTASEQTNSEPSTAGPAPLLRLLDRAAIEFKDLAGKMLVELRGSKGQTIYPPSIHEEGEPIRWDRFGEPGDLSLADLKKAVAKVAAAALLVRHWPAKNSRDQAFMALAGGLIRDGWSTEDARYFLQAVAVATNDEEERKRLQRPGGAAKRLEEDKLFTGWTKLASLLTGDGHAVTVQVRKWLGVWMAKKKGGKKIIHGLEPYQPFPVEALPYPLGGFVEQVAKAVGCDSAFVAVPLLAVLASLIGNTPVIRLKSTWREVPVLWTAIVGDSGTLKSPALSIITNPTRSTTPVEEKGDRP